MIIHPSYIQSSKEGKTAIDPYTMLMNENIVLLFSEINDDLAQSIIAQLMLLEVKNPKADIQLYINSPGGSVTAGLAILDVMNKVSNPISTVAVGSCASMAAVLLAAGAPGKRYALPHAQIMIHQPLGGAQGQASDVLIAAERIKNVRSELNGLLAEYTGKPIAQIEKDTDRDNYLSAQSALEYRLIDKIL